MSGFLQIENSARKTEAEMEKASIVTRHGNKIQK